MKSRQEIEDVLGSLSLEGPRFPGMTYEDGIEAALRWAIEETDEEPYPDE